MRSNRRRESRRSKHTVFRVAGKMRHRHATKLRSRMNDHEIRTWARDWAAAETVVAIGDQASTARDEWRDRMRDDSQEMLDALPHCADRVTPMHALRDA